MTAACKRCLTVACSHLDAALRRRRDPSVRSSKRAHRHAIGAPSPTLALLGGGSTSRSTSATVNSRLRKRQTKLSQQCAMRCADSRRSCALRVRRSSRRTTQRPQPSSHASKQMRRRSMSHARCGRAASNAKRREAPTPSLASR